MKSFMLERPGLPTSRMRCRRPCVRIQRSVRQQFFSLPSLEIDNDKKTASRKASFFTSEILGFRLDCETDSGLAFSCNLGLILQVGAAFVKRRNDCEQNCRSQHDPDEKHEVAGPL